MTFYAPTTRIIYFLCDTELNKRSVKTQKQKKQQKPMQKFLHNKKIKNS